MTPDQKNRDRLYFARPIESYLDNLQERLVEIGMKTLPALGAFLLT